MECTKLKHELEKMAYYINNLDIDFDTKVIIVDKTKPANYGGFVVTALVRL